MFTAKMFIDAGIDFRFVVEPQEMEPYSVFGDERLLMLPENGRGLVYARNWIKDHATAEGHERHWQFDDDVQYFMRVYRGYRLYCEPITAIVVLEDFVDRYENVALASFNYEFFTPVYAGVNMNSMPPFYLNHRCYTVLLMLNLIPNRFRNRYNEDTDMSLQVLADGWCTILLNAFVIKTPTTMTHQGGQTDIYVSDGRLRMARQLERVWPGVVSTTRRFKKPQHYVKGEWTKFDTLLKLKPNVDLSAMPKVYEYGLKLHKIAPVQSEGLRRLIDGV